MSMACWKSFRAVAFVAASCLVVGSAPKALAADSSLMQSDGLHPSEWGSQVVAMAFTDEIDSVSNGSSNHSDVVVCLGDSITEGYGATGYPAYLETMTDKTCVNAGISGSQSIRGATRVRSLLYQYRPAYLCVLYGANDVITGKPAYYTIENLKFICDSAEHAFTCPILATLTPMSGAYAGNNAKIKDLNNKIRALALAGGYRLVDLEDEFE
ncbi:MAG: SGNH/GDSL hydrolase family protein [Kiritimatiellia bacterium]